MTNEQTETLEHHYETRFAWRIERQIYNFIELAQIAESRGADPIKALPNLAWTTFSDDPKDAMRWSILLLTAEATECFIFGEFQSCILTCGAVVERAFKLEYETLHGLLPEGEWTLGRCIHKLDCQALPVEVLGSLA